MLEDHELISRISRQDHNALEILIKRYQDYVYSLCMMKLKDRHMSEEAAQDVFLKVFRFSNSFRKESKVSTWLYTITHRVCLDKIRSKNINRVVELDTHTTSHVVSNNAESLLERADVNHGISRMLEQLDDRSRQVVGLHYLKELSLEEIGQITGLTVSNIKIILFRSRNKLKSMFQEHYQKGMMK